MALGIVRGAVLVPGRRGPDRAPTLIDPGAQDDVGNVIGAVMRPGAAIAAPRAGIVVFQRNRGEDAVRTGEVVLDEVYRSAAIAQRRIGMGAKGTGAGIGRRIESRIRPAHAQAAERQPGVIRIGVVAAAADAAVAVELPADIADQRAPFGLGTGIEEDAGASRGVPAAMREAMKVRRVLAVLGIFALVEITFVVVVVVGRPELEAQLAADAQARLRPRN